MSVVATLMDKARERRGIPTDMALGERLGRSRQIVSQWRSGDKYPDEDVIVQLAELAGDDPAQWLIAVKAIRTEGPAGKVWAALARRLATTAALLAVVVFPALPERAQAATQDVSAAQSRHYAKWLIGLVWHWLAQRLPKPKPSPGNVEASICA